MQAAMEALQWPGGVAKLKFFDLRKRRHHGREFDPQAGRHVQRKNGEFRVTV
jgi:hypothetical protein